VDHRHEQVGARFLANWFGSAVTRPVQMHVSAKRYLCATDQSYFDGLSPASVHSLELQGGPMTPDEAIAYRANPYHAEAVELRRWDDLAKVSGAPTPGFDVFHGLIIDVLEAR
jgi:gamma-butyrobetaine dioxygenase